MSDKPAGSTAGRIVLTGAKLIDREGAISGPSTIIIKDGLIAEILPGDGSGEAAPKLESVSRLGWSPGDRVIDCRGHFISPGLVNLHAHSPMNIFKGIAEDVTLEDWFNREIWPFESNMDGDDVEAGARLAVAEMLDYGVTAFADHYFEAGRICDVALETGIRADIAPTLFGMAGDFNDQLAAAEELIRNRNGEQGRLSLRLGPHSPYTCSPDQLAMCAESARSLGVGAHLHVEDDLAQIEASRELYGMTPMEVVSRAGLMDNPLIIGHAYWILPEERVLLKENNWIAVCMMTYMKLGYPPGPILDDPGDLPLCIGTDGAASSNCLNPLEQARLLALAGKSRQGNAEAFSLRTVWRMLMRGHDALPFGTGRLIPGDPADLVVWNLDLPHTAPAYNPLAALIYSGDARNAEHVLIAGDFVKEDGRLKLDTKSIVREAKERAGGILAKGKGSTKLVF